MSPESATETFNAPGDPEWVASLPSDQRQGYEAARAEDIAETTDRVSSLIRQHLGEGLDQPAVTALAGAIAIHIRTAHEGGVQVGLDATQAEADRYQEEANRLGFAIANMPS